MDPGGRSRLSYIDISSSDEEEDDGFSTVESSVSDYDDNDNDNGKQQKMCRYIDISFQESSAAVCGVNDILTAHMDVYRKLNLAQKIRQREYMGRLSFCKKSAPYLSSVPNRLSFCFKDLVPAHLLQGHMFMGLTACGQFLLSYKVCSADSGPNISQYSFSMGYKYTLFFWIYEPFKPLSAFYKCLLFDDHGVDNMKEVSMIQWKNSDSRILIVHGASEEENEDSYITYIKVPKLGCLDCRKQRDTEEDEGSFRRQILCIKCNLTVHTKYSTTESDCKFDPQLHLICPERILVISNGFFHVLHIDMQQPPTEHQQPQVAAVTSHQTASSVLMLRPVINGVSMPNSLLDVHRSTPPVPFSHNTDNDNFSVDSQTTNNSQSNLVNRIIEDFPDIETDSTHSGSGVAIAAPHRTLATCLKSPTVASIAHESPISQIPVSRKSCEELVFTCNPSTSNRIKVVPSAITNAGTPATMTGISSKNNTLLQTGPRRRHRIVTKSFRKGVSIFFSSSGITTTHTTINSSTSTSSAAGSSPSTDRASAYEFCEENEKCEKISIFRKRRLAERKYEFSEDNSENIIPFTKTRSSSTNSLRSFLNSPTTGSHSPRQSLAHLHNSPSPYASPSSSPQAQNSNIGNGQYDLSRHYATPCSLSPLRHSCSSPLGFRSPPSSSGLNNNVSGGVMRSPNRHFITNHFSNNHKSPPHGTSQVLSPATQYMLSFKPHGTLSPLQLSITKRTHLERGGSVSPNHQHPFLSPRRDDIRSFEVPLQAGTMSEKPVCTKRFRRRYVEEDDAASVITSEEDDCISPGYHTLLPMEVHGSCYSEMQMISKASFQQLRCISVVIEQHSFDMETFTYYVISTLCQKNLKSYDFFYDWAYELIKVCPISSTIFCLLMAHFSARDEVSSCMNCSRKLTCAFHLRQFECRVLFSWNMITGEWSVLDFGELHDYKLHNISSRMALEARSPLTLSKRAKKLAREMAQSLNKIPDYTSNLRVLESNINKTKKTISDVDNMIEFYLKTPPRSMS